MKRLYSLLLSTLLLVVGGVEVKAQTLIKSWDFTKASEKTITTGTEANGDTLYNSIGATDLNINGVIRSGIEEKNEGVNLYFKGKTEIGKSSNGSYLKINSKADMNDMRAGVRIPAKQGHIVKVTGSAESTNETYTWVGAEIDTNLGEEMFWNKQETKVAGVAISG